MANEGGGRLNSGGDIPSAFAELQATREELQVSKEELEASKEELQALNRQLKTVNAELRDKVRELAAANGDLQNLFSTTDVGIVFLDRDLCIKRFTPAATSMFPLRESDLGRHITDLVPVGDCRDIVQAAAETLRTLNPGELQVQAAGGHAWFIVRFLPYRTVTNEIDGVVVTCTDISAVRQAEDHLRRALAKAEQGEARLRLALEGLSLLTKASLRVMAETDLKAMLDAIANAAVALTGASMAICGHDLLGDGEIVCSGTEATIWSAATLTAVAQRIDAVFPDEESVRLNDAEVRLRLGLPDVELHGLLAARFRERGGKTTGLLLVTDKANGSFTAEDEALLRQLAAVSSLALAHVDARMSLEDSDRRKSDFLAVLSHELRNPLAAIRTSLSIWDRAPIADEKARRAQSVIDRQVGHLTRLVDDLLDITRVSRGKIQLRRERLDLCDLVIRTVDDYREAYARGGLGLGLSVPDRAIHVDADRTRIAQVLGNLLGNSLKFTPAGGSAMVSIECDDDLGEVVLHVRDTGIGIEQDMLQRIFEPFAQADTSLDRSKGGLGLGLAMVKGLVEMHGGSATAASAGVGAGAHFTIRLPTAGPEAPRPTPAPQIRVPVPRRLLVIEDNFDEAVSLCELLRLSGHTVEIALSGADGLQKARALRPDVVLCDIGLPGMDGYELARTVRNDPLLRTTRLVAVTGYAGPADVAKTIAAGFDAHLAKPFTLDVFDELLAQPTR